jgi:hypothetical protein
MKRMGIDIFTDSTEMVANIAENSVHRQPNHNSCCAPLYSLYPAAF